MSTSPRILVTFAIVVSLLAQGVPAWAVSAESEPAPNGQVVPEAEVSTPAEVRVIVLDAERLMLAQRLAELGRPHDEALALVSQLTDDDLAVFTENPGMIQSAGTTSHLTEAYVITTLIVVGIIILAANGNGFANIS